MAGDYPIAAQLQSPAEQPVKFQIPVAVNAGIGGQAPFIAVGEFAHDLPVKILGKIKGVVPDAELRGYRTGVLHIFQGAAGAFFRGVVVQAHGGADALVARLLHQKGSHRAVHAAAHADERTHIVHKMSSKVSFP